MLRKSSKTSVTARMRILDRVNTRSDRLDRILVRSAALVLSDPMSIDEVDRWLHAHPPTALMILSRPSSASEYEITINMDELESRVEREGIPRTDEHFEDWCHAAIERLIDHVNAMEFTAGTGQLPGESYSL